MSLNVEFRGPDDPPDEDAPEVQQFGSGLDWDNFAAWAKGLDGEAFPAIAAFADAAEADHLDGLSAELAAALEADPDPKAAAVAKMLAEMFADRPDDEVASIAP